MKRLWYVVVMISVVPWYVVSMDDPHESRSQLDRQIESTQRAYDKKIKKASTQEAKNRLAIERDRAVQKIKDLAVLGKKVADLGNVTGMRAYFLAMLDQLNRERLANNLTPIPVLAISSIIGYAESIKPVTSDMKIWLAKYEAPIKGATINGGLSPDGAYVWILFSDDSHDLEHYTVKLYRTSDWQQIGDDIKVGDITTGVIAQFSPDSKYLVVRTHQKATILKKEKPRISFYNVSNGQTVKKINLNKNALDVKFSYDGSYFMVTLPKNVSALYTITDLQHPVHTFKRVHRWWFDSTGNYFLVRDLDKKISRYDVSDWKKVPANAFYNDLGPFESWGFSPHKKYLWKHNIVDGKHSVAVYMTSDLEKNSKQSLSDVTPKKTFKDGGKIKFSADNTYALVYFAQNKVALYKVDGWQSLGIVKGNIVRVITHNEKYLMLINYTDKKLTIVDILEKKPYSIITFDKGIHEIWDGSLQNSMYVLSGQTLWVLDLAIENRLQNLLTEELQLLVYLYDAYTKNRLVPLSEDEKKQLINMPKWLQPKLAMLRNYILPDDDQAVYDDSLLNLLKNAHDNEQQAMILLANVEFIDKVKHASQAVRDAMDSLKKQYEKNE